MRVIITESFEESSKIAGGMVLNVIIQKPDARLGLATGDSVRGIYDYLIKKNKAGEVDFSKVCTINLDEYVGLGAEHPQSYRYFMDCYLFDHINIEKKNTIVPCGIGNMDENIKEFRRQIEQAPIDIQLLGVGADGHIGFNEPGPALYCGAYIEELSDSTIEANSRFFPCCDDVPRRAVTMGLGDIMKARRIILIATGERKAEAISGVIMNDTVNTDNPATMIKMHPDATVIIDKQLADIIGYEY
ncbi:MAG: glucosamine-6-phosphate deaminase [Christensenellales bacterium]|jgi:glucosamine-6-phosphate deaminase